MEKLQFVLGVDIGGTTIKPALYLVGPDGLSDQPVWKEPVDTQLGVEAHREQMADIIATANRRAQEMGGEIVGIGIASPGRFKDGVIKKGTNPNMGKDSVSDFDGVNLEEEYKAALWRKDQELLKIPMVVGNDGNAMLAGMVGDIMREPGDLDLRGKRVGVLGIGTGLGHAIADVDASGEMKFVTDGHASKLRIKVDDQDWPMVQEAIDKMNKPGKKPEIVYFEEDHSVRAEDLFRAPVLEKLTGAKSGADIRPDEPKHAAVLAFAGKYVGRLIKEIREGQGRDEQPDNAWTPEERADAAKTQVYLVGGGIGRGENTGKAIIAHAEAELAASGINDVQLVRIPGDNPATFAAAEMVPPSSYLGSTPGAGAVPLAEAEVQPPERVKKV